MFQSRRRAVPDFEGGNYFDLFLIAAIITILLTRFYLLLTGYPQVAMGGLHIAHMLWGGLGMLIALVMLLLFLGRQIKYPASLVGGIGFGLFIDELGKFITKDNDYFFQPTIALIYLVFIALYLVVRSIHREQMARPGDYLVNALVEMEEVVVDDLESRERDRIRHYLDHSPQDDPLTRAVRGVLESARVVPDHRPPAIIRLRRRLDEAYRSVADGRRFSWFVILVAFALQAAGSLRGMVVIFFSRGGDAAAPVMFHPGQKARALASLGMIDWILGVSFVVSGIFVILGALMIFRHRLAAYRMFQRSLLVSIFVTQPFMFYRDQWSAMIELVVVCLFYALTRYLIDAESQR